MKAKANIQWKQGSRPQKFDREDGQWEFEMAALKKRVHDQQFRPVKKKPVLFKEGQLVLAYGRLETCGEVDPDGEWVKFGGHKHGVEGIKTLPRWFLDQYDILIGELYGAK